MLDGNFKMCYLDAKYKTENIKSAEKLSTFNTRIFGTDLEQLYVYICIRNFGTYPVKLCKNVYIV